MNCVISYTCTRSTNIAKLTCLFAFYEYCYWNYKNVLNIFLCCAFFAVGDGRLGFPDEAPYDAIHVGAAAPTLPKAVCTLCIWFNCCLYSLQWSDLNMCINSSWNSWNQVGDLFCLWARRVEAKFSSSMTVRAMALSSGKRWWVWFMSHWQTNTTSGQGMYHSIWDESDSERSDLYCTVAHHICFSSQWWALIAVWLPLQEMALVLWFSKPLVLREGLSSHLTCCLSTHSSGSFGFLTKNWSSNAAVDWNQCCHFWGVVPSHT